MILPLVEELHACPEPIDVLAAFQDQPATLLLESSRKLPELGRYSFFMADPFELFQQHRTTFGDRSLQKLQSRSEQFTSNTIPNLPPFQGGFAGLLGYEFGHALEKLPAAIDDSSSVPDFCVGVYDWVIAWDHLQQRAWIISHGFPESDSSKQLARATMRLEWVKTQLTKSIIEPVPKPSSRTPLRFPGVPLKSRPEIVSNFSRDDYLIAVQTVIDYIKAGDIFQANLSQQLLAPLEETPLNLYRRLRTRNPAPFSGYFACDEWAILSASPERFLSVREGCVETRPIKGTRQRQQTPEADLFTRDELRASLKDQAENVMIVDLLRNDLSRVCLPGTLSVPQLCEVETYETVQHLVSVVQGQLRPGATVWNLLEATFPGGSITGAPKVRAQQIITELERLRRGPYCGSLISVGFDGTFDSNILIRTFTCESGWARFPVGGGIVADSDPILEYEETLHKAEGLFRALDFPTR